jgi:hypothetical protein
VKYVQVYESSPQVVYVGYTPGYMGCYVYGPTVIYGTGYYYNPWYGAVYYPRPCTYGFSMHYNPWTGWSMGVHYSSGYFHMSVYGGGYHGGYWGPPMYHPPYHGGYHGGYYGNNYHGGGNTINIDNSRNFYGNGSRPGVTPARPTTRPSTGNGGNASTRPSQKPPQAGQRPTTKPAQGGDMAGGRPTQQPSKGGTKPATQPANGNSVLTDKQGNVYRDKGGSYQQMGHDGKWQDTQPTRPAGGGTNAPATKPAARPTMTPNTQQQLNRDMQNRQRGQQNMNNFQQRSAPAARPSNFGGGRPSGGGRRR